MAELEPTKASEYRAKYVQSKIVQTPTGAIFKIRPISPLDYINERLPLGVTTDIKSGREFVKGLILNCVLEPKIVIENAKEDELLLDNLSFGDYQFLTKEITDFSTGGQTDFLATGQSS